MSDSEEERELVVLKEKDVNYAASLKKSKPDMTTYIQKEVNREVA